jgi:hypothetical protein
MPCLFVTYVLAVDGIPDRGAVYPIRTMDDDLRPHLERRSTPAAARCLRAIVLAAVCLGVSALGGVPLHAQGRDQGADPHHQPGFIDAVGSFFADSWDTVKSATKLPVSTPENGAVSTSPARAPEAQAPVASTQAPVTQVPVTNGSAAPTTEASGLIPTLGARDLVDGRKKCGRAPNGAPDCTAAVLAVCKTKGFKSGVSVAIESALNCPATAWLSGSHSPNREDCRTDAYVTRAACR